MEFKNIVFILWGNPSQKKEFLINTAKHCVLKAPHPSPLSSYRGFFGSKPFSQANKYLKSKFDKILTETDIFINPSHTQMGNQGKMQKRREFLSQDGKIYCSVANLNLKKHRERKKNNSLLSLDSFKSLQY